MLWLWMCKRPILWCLSSVMLSRKCFWLHWWRRNATCSKLSSLALNAASICGVSTVKQLKLRWSTYVCWKPKKISHSKRGFTVQFTAIRKTSRLNWLKRAWLRFWRIKWQIPTEQRITNSIRQLKKKLFKRKPVFTPFPLYSNTHSPI